MITDSIMNQFTKWLSNPPEDLDSQVNFNNLSLHLFGVCRPITTTTEAV
ncbi:MAG: hypothetical protein IH795_06280 [Bacteroidetes bacterium]|nr:hypothetical protein [Bacteroidota bacterium]